MDAEFAAKIKTSTFNDSFFKPVWKLLMSLIPFSGLGVCGVDSPGKRHSARLNITAVWKSLKNLTVNQFDKTGPTERLSLWLRTDQKYQGEEE